MSEHIRFGIETSDMHGRLFVDLPGRVLEGIIGEQQYEGIIQRKVRRLKSPVVADPHAGSADARLYVNTNLIGKKKDEAWQQRVLGRVAQLVNLLGDYPEPAVADPQVRVVLGSQTEGTSDSLAMYAALVLDKTVGDEVLSSRATRQMQSIAASLHYVEPDLIPHTVGATVYRDYGVSLTVNPAGSCALNTNNATYNPNADRIELYGPNLSSYTHQLTCLAGVIALAREPELKQTS